MNAVFKFFVSISLLMNFTAKPLLVQSGPEICNNSIDDDNDGLIDLNDDDCYCEPLERPSLIPNPSFEEQDCCPDGHSSLNCATGWLQASEGTTDYFHACDYDGNDIFTLPQPIPDGEGFAGIIDGSFTGKLIPELKEYVGTCLSTPTKPDSLYRIQFHIGFLDRKYSPDIDIALFGTTDCANLPFGIGDRSFGCPANSPNWVQLGSVDTYGHNEWKKEQFTFRTDLEIKAVALGPSCSLRSATNNPYHFLDQLILEENSNFDLGITVKGKPCEDDLKFEIRPLDGYEYQWYKNGIAIPDAISQSLANPSGKGDYQVRLTNREGCKVSKIYSYNPPIPFDKISETICSGETYQFKDRQLTEPGIYWDTIATENYCESNVRLELFVNQEAETNLTTKIFPGESIQIGTETINNPGEHTFVVSTQSGCDSTIHLSLDYYSLFVPNTFSPNGDLVNDVFSIYSSADLQMIKSLSVFDRWGTLAFHAEDLDSEQGWDGTTNGKKAPGGIYAYTAQVQMTDNKLRMLHGTLSLIR